jgi:two-component system, OmpR family, sensor histidine kinase PrrB
VSRPLSIRVRVTIAASAAVALALVGGGVLIVANFAQRERSRLDQELEGRARGPAARAPALRLGLRRGLRSEEGPPPAGAPPPGEGAGGEARPGEGAGRGAPPGEAPGPATIEGPPGLLAESGSFVRVIRGRRVLRAAGDVPDEGFPLPKRPGLETVEAGGRRWRALTIEPHLPPGLEAAAGATTRAQFAVDLEPLEDRIGAMRTRVALISGLGIVLAAVLSSLLSGLALAPLSRLRRTVAGVSSTRDLSRRLPDTDAAEEVNELARSVNAMLIRLERSTAETEGALEATRRFAADVGHELRTPLTSIRANLDSLRRNPSMPEAERRTILDEVAAEQHELVELLDALQALARGDAAASLPRQSLDFTEIVGAAVETTRRRHREARIELAVSDDRQQVIGWPDGLRLLVENIVENAVRHGGSRVRVTLRRDGAAAGALLLSVEDDGPGVPEAERERVFERFRRGSATTAPGSGLGLALVAQQASLHGGGVEVGDSPLGGACFTVRLPLDD